MSFIPKIGAKNLINIDALKNTAQKIGEQKNEKSKLSQKSSEDEQVSIEQYDIQNSALEDLDEQLTDIEQQIMQLEQSGGGKCNKDEYNQKRMDLLEKQASILEQIENKFDDIHHEPQLDNIQLPDTSMIKPESTKGV